MHSFARAPDADALAAWVDGQDVEAVDARAGDDGGHGPPPSRSRLSRMILSYSARFALCSAVTFGPMPRARRQAAAASGMLGHRSSCGWSCSHCAVALRCSTRRSRARHRGHFLIVTNVHIASPLFAYGNMVSKSPLHCACASASISSPIMRSALAQLSDIDTEAVDSLKVLDPNRPIREASTRPIRSINLPP